MSMSEQELQDVNAALHVEQKIRSLQQGNEPIPLHQLEKALSESRQRTHNTLSPQAQHIVEVTLRQVGILKLDNVYSRDSDKGVLDKFLGGEPA